MSSAPGGGMDDSASFLFSPNPKTCGWIISAAHVERIQQALAKIDHANWQRVGSALRRLGVRSSVGISLWYTWLHGSDKHRLSEADCLREWQALDVDRAGLRSIFLMAGSIPVQRRPDTGLWYRLSDFAEVSNVTPAAQTRELDEPPEPQLPHTGSVAAALLLLLADRGRVRPGDMGLENDIAQFNASVHLLNALGHPTDFTNFQDGGEDFAELSEYDECDGSAVKKRDEFLASEEFEEWRNAQIVRLATGEFRGKIR
jgi:hypothetical protein